MSDSTYLLGTDVLGAPVASSTTGPAVVIRLTDPAGTVAAKGGATGELAYRFAPQAVTDMALKELVLQVRKAFAAEKVAADVSVVNLDSSGSASGSVRAGRPSFPDLFTGVIVGATASTLGYGLIQLIRHMFAKKGR